MDKICVKKAYSDGKVGVRFTLKASGWHGDTIKIEGATDLSAAQARDLARALIEEAERAEARVAAKEAAIERRKKWRDREVAAGRMKLASF